MLVLTAKRDYVAAIMSNLIYKVCSSGQWQAAQSAGVYEGSDDDRRDGFIHFSTAGQLAVTLDKHFAGQDDLILITVDAGSLGGSLKWEKSRGGDLFPHLYGSLAVTGAIRTQALPLGPDGFILPELEAS